MNNARKRLVVTVKAHKWCMSHSRLWILTFRPPRRRKAELRRKVRSLETSPFALSVLPLALARPSARISDHASPQNAPGAQLSTPPPPPVALPRGAATETATIEISDGVSPDFAGSSAGKSALGMPIRCLPLLPNLSSYLPQDTEGSAGSPLTTCDLTTNLLANVPAKTPVNVAQRTPADVSGNVLHPLRADVAPISVPLNNPENVQGNMRPDIEGYVHANDTERVTADVSSPSFASMPKTDPKKPVRYAPVNDSAETPLHVFTNVLPCLSLSIPPSVPASMSSSTPASIPPIVTGCVSLPNIAKAPLLIVANASRTFSADVLPLITVNAPPSVLESHLKHGKANAKASRSTKAYP